MKFLLFNLVVAVSLYYLFHTGELAPTALGNRAQVVVSQVKQSATASPSQPNKGARKVATARETSRKTPTAPPVEKPVEKTRPPKQTAVAATPPAAVPTAKPKVSASPPLPPEVAQRRAEVLGEVPVTSIPTTPAPILMSHSIRRQELHALAEEMEFRSLGWRSE
jgi:hypothetical protein